MSVVANGTGQRWKAGRDAFEAFVAAAQELKIDLNAPGPGETEKLALKAGYSRTYLYTVQQDLRNGRLSDRVPPVPAQLPEPPKAVPAELCEDESTAPTPSVAPPDAELVAQLAQVTAERDAARVEITCLDLALKAGVGERQRIAAELEAAHGENSQVASILECYRRDGDLVADTLRRLMGEYDAMVALLAMPPQQPAGEEPMVPKRLVSGLVALLPDYLDAQKAHLLAEQQLQAVDKRKWDLLAEFDSLAAAA